MKRDDERGEPEHRTERPLSNVEPLDDDAGPKSVTERELSDPGLRAVGRRRARRKILESFENAAALAAASGQIAGRTDEGDRLRHELSAMVEMCAQNDPEQAAELKAILQHRSLV